MILKIYFMQTNRLNKAKTLNLEFELKLEQLAAGATRATSALSKYSPRARAALNDSVPQYCFIIQSNVPFKPKL
jgi:hypothetical protein